MNFDFTFITADNIHHYKNLKKVYVDYKFRTLKNNGEKPFGKKQLSGLFDSSVKNNQFIVMDGDGKFLGFAVISTCSKDIIDIPFPYGTVNEFYISPKNRRKGYGRILNNFIENIFEQSRTDTVLLHPDPVTGIDFWKAVGYKNTGINGGWRRWQVYVKNLKETDNAKNIKTAIDKLVTQTDLISVNPYNTNQIKELAVVYKEYCRENNLRYRKKDVKAMAVTARKIKEAKLNALYFEGRIIGFSYRNEKEIHYVLPHYRQLDFGNGRKDTQYHYKEA